VCQYKFIVDGEWVADSENAESVDDGLGGLNSVLYVSCGESIDVAGLWESNGGYQLEISNEAFVQDYLGDLAPLSHSVVLHDNAMNYSIVQSAWDSTFEVLVWTDIAEDGSWWYCQSVIGQESALAAFQAEGKANADDPAGGGCGEQNFAWNKMLPLDAPTCDPSLACDDTCPCGEGDECVEGACVEACVPAAACSEAMVCGSMEDGCGGTIECGTCADGETCNAGVCEEEAAAFICSPVFAECTEEDFVAGDMTEMDGPIAIDIVAMAPYSPKCARVQVGQTVTIASSAIHPFEKVCAEDEVMDSAEGSAGDVEFTFSTPGYYNYQCGNHMTMVGNIHVIP